jgi:hypothetical protein
VTTLTTGTWTHRALTMTITFIGICPYLDHADYEDVPHDNYAAHSDVAAAGHLDSPRLEGTWNQAA